MVKSVLIWKYWVSNKRSVEAFCLFRIQEEAAGDIQKKVWKIKIQNSVCKVYHICHKAEEKKQSMQKTMQITREFLLVIKSKNISLPIMLYAQPSIHNGYLSVFHFLWTLVL